MKKGLIAMVACLIAALLVPACDLTDGIGAESKRVTFALVIDTRSYDGKKIYAGVATAANETSQAEVITTLQGVFESYPNTATHSWAKMTTLDEIETNEGYFLDFFIDMNEDGEEATGDLAGIQHFDVMPNAIWSETKYFTSDLETVP